MSRTDPSDAPLLAATQLHKRFGANEVLRGIDLTLHRGEVVVLIGPSGSGKTTVLRSLNGLETPDAGTIAVDGGPEIDFAGRVSSQQRFALRDRSAMVFQHHNLFPHFTVLENVIEGPWRVQGRPKGRPSTRLGCCWIGSVLPTRRMRDRISSPAVSSSASGSSARSRSAPICCSSTSPPARSTRNWSARCCW
ncbi:hypothetical protein GCM10025863_00170 [Microbacterium suwonense]|uniref:ABC transporter domain-containing protein n=1 Tax=Microbacterium suwonense TaxID=683047 RepID=A0ABM8FPS0_9MICO|nr:hypothetical protein GCM10025863_00170 [Microbacterium suwonense]